MPRIEMFGNKRTQLYHGIGKGMFIEREVDE
jgi:hypothetical protein